ncbi:MAG: hypothetical protein ACRDFZ_00825 [Candidatus Limnocylindria bacterium]
MTVLGGCNPVAPAGGGGIPYPRGAVVVVRMESIGGFALYEALFTSIPGFTLLGDGRVIIVGVHDPSVPGPAAPDLRVRRLTEQGIQSVLLRLGESGQLDDSASWTGRQATVVDAATTRFTVRAHDREVVVDVYALGMASEQGVTVDLPPDEQAAHEALTAVEADLLDLDSWVPADEWADPGWQIYEPPAIRLLIGNVDGEEPMPEAGEPMEWPGTIPPGQLGQESPLEALRCGVVAGAEAGTWYAALRQATEVTRWFHDGHLYRVVPRPLLPDEELTCGTLEG